MRRNKCSWSCDSLILLFICMIMTKDEAFGKSGNGVNASGSEWESGKRRAPDPKAAGIKRAYQGGGEGSTRRKGN